MSDKTAMSQPKDLSFDNESFFIGVNKGCGCFCHSCNTMRLILWHLIILFDSDFDEIKYVLQCGHIMRYQIKRIKD